MQLFECLKSIPDPRKKRGIRPVAALATASKKIEILAHQFGGLLYRK